MYLKDIMDKYSRYKLEYDVKDKMLFINSVIPVKDFIRLKQDIFDNEIELTDIRVYGRW